MLGVVRVRVEVTRPVGDGCGGGEGGSHETCWY